MAVKPPCFTALFLSPPASLAFPRFSALFISSFSFPSPLSPPPAHNQRPARGRSITNLPLPLNPCQTNKKRRMIFHPPFYAVTGTVQPFMAAT